MSYVARLKEAIRRAKEGDFEQGLNLSNELHEFEADDGELTDEEDRLWMELTTEIELAERE